MDRSRRDLIAAPLHSRRGRLFLAVVGLGIFLWGAERQGSEVNHYLLASDQFEYVTYATNMARTDFEVVGPRSRMPIYPGLMALFYRDGMSDQEFFERGKQVGVVLALLVLGIVFVVFRLAAGPIDATGATLVVAFTVFVYKAPYFQCELLFYGATLVLFVGMLALLERPRPGLAAAVGVAAGVGYLIKASVAPGLAACLAALGLRALLELRGAPTDAGAGGTGSRAATGRVLATHLGAAAIVVACFLVVVSPYLRTSKRVFGHYFYNVTTTFYMWYDSWDEAEAGTRSHGDEIGWPDLPAAELPSLGRYLREHSGAEIASRLLGGLAVTLREVFLSYGYAWFLLLYLAAAAAFARQRTSTPRDPVRPRDARGAFVAAYFGVYLLLYAWYTPIASGNRFVLALFLPAMFLALRTLAMARAQGLYLRLAGGRVEAGDVAAGVFLLLAVYVVVALPFQVASVFGGT